MKKNQKYIYIYIYMYMFFGRNDANDEAPKLWPPDAKNCLIGKDLDAGKD